MGKRATNLQPEVVLKNFPTDDILNHKEAISHIRRKTSLDEDTIEKSIDKLIAEKKLITARTPKGLYLRKMRKLY